MKGEIMKILMTLGIMILLAFAFIGMAVIATKVMEYLENNHQHIINKIKKFLMPIVMTVLIFAIYFTAIYSIL